jgi:hypothetical protein
MANLAKTADYRQGVNDFLNAAARGVETGAEAFDKMVDDLDGNFRLAVLNVGEVAFGRVLGSEKEITSDEKRKHPNVAESIACVRSGSWVRLEF